MIKKTFLDHFQVMRDGTIHVRFSLEIIDDDGRSINRKWHRTSFPPGTDIDEALRANNFSITENQHYPAIDDAEVQVLHDIRDMVWTDEKIIAQQDKLKAVSPTPEIVEDQKAVLIQERADRITAKEEAIAAKVAAEKAQ